MGSVFSCIAYGLGAAVVFIAGIIIVGFMDFLWAWILRPIWLPIRCLLQWAVPAFMRKFCPNHPMVRLERELNELREQREQRLREQLAALVAEKA